LLVINHVGATRMFLIAVQEALDHTSCCSDADPPLARRLTPL
jgi:hypothetical protein